MSTIFQGDWVFKKEIKVPLAYSTCPKTLKYIDSHSTLHDQIEKYNCSTYKAAVFSPNCKMLSFHDALRRIEAKRRGSQMPLLIYTIGDSLLGNLFIAGKCTIESKNVTVISEYFPELLFRRDVPCDPQCVTVKDYREFMATMPLLSSCEGCPDGIQHSLSEFEYNTPWLRRIPVGTDILILGAGTWYNFYRGYINSSLTYTETIQFIAPILRYLVVTKGVDVYWLDLPPYVAPDEGEGKENPFYEWDKFEWKNRVAEKLLSAVGVKFIDSWSALHQRKQADIAVSDSGHLHWCTPGAFSVPAFLFHSVLHLHAVSYT